jgi:hypothetical protein
MRDDLHRCGKERRQASTIGTAKMAKSVRDAGAPTVSITR